MADRKYKFNDPKAAFAVAENRIQQALKTGAKELDLRNLGLAEVPKSIVQLSQLRKLRLDYNRLTAVRWISQLVDLQVLLLHENQLTVLPESLGKLTQLRKLALSGNQLTRVPASLGRLRLLEELVLDRNRLTVVPESLGQLSHLELLSLENNQLTFVPESLGHLTRLRDLYIKSNLLKVLPDSLRELAALKRLDLRGNDALGLPREVLEPTRGALGDPAAILDYYYRLRIGKCPLNEAKLILLGRGEVGKTCVVNRLVRDTFAPTKMTKGIAIAQWTVTVEDTVRLHVWDFGGQEIQHATHQFFLTERSLYLVVLNGRADAEDDDAEYWLKIVKIFGGSSPTIVVLNKFKVQPFQVNRRALKEKYPFIRAFVETDCEPDMENGIPELKREIESALAAMDHVRANFPASWFQIKERMSKMKEPFIPFAEYRKICAQLGENDAQAQERLAGFLNALGIALNFREDQQLREETVLNPHWITEGVYQIITSEVLAERQGELRLADLARILPKKAYPIRMHRFLIELMRKFELCFPYSNYPFEDRFVVPELLGKEEPKFEEPFPPSNCLNFRYTYQWIPGGLFSRFIVRAHSEFIAATRMLSRAEERWRTGVVLHWEGCRALVKADKQERQVLVRVLGEPEKRRRLLAVVRENFDQIHAEMKDLKPTEWVALDGHPEEWISFGELEKLQKKNVAEFSKSLGDGVVSVSVSKLLAETDVLGARKKDDAGDSQQRPLKLFVSYAQSDEKWRVRLKPNLELLQREGLIEIWSDRQIVAGSKWDEEIQRKLNEAELYLFFMSTHLLNSDYVRKHELPAALKRFEGKKAGFVPVVVQWCNWKPYVGAIQVLPSGGRPIGDWKPHDRACFDVEEGLRKTIAEVRRWLRLF